MYAVHKREGTSRVGSMIELSLSWRSVRPVALYAWVLIPKPFTQSNVLQSPAVTKLKATPTNSDQNRVVKPEQQKAISKGVRPAADDESLPDWQPKKNQARPPPKANHPDSQAHAARDTQPPQEGTNAEPLAT
jgi:hypothetical protein